MHRPLQRPAQPPHGLLVHLARQPTNTSLPLQNTTQSPRQASEGLLLATMSTHDPHVCCGEMGMLMAVWG